MLDSETRATILFLSRQGNGVRAIARLLKVSRNSVKKVLRQGTDDVPSLARVELATPHLDEIRRLYALCRGNLVRVHEELIDAGIELAYSTLTSACRRHEIGAKPKKPTGRYHFEPGEEMQHDTSPHDVIIGGKKTRVQCASLVLCFSRMQFAQCYPTFNRFYCKVFLTDALQFMDGACHNCMIDNTHVVLVGGSGKTAIVAPEMIAFAQHFGFEFIAHEIGDANRSARVEGPFNFIERNFYAGREFADLADLNRQLTTWCREKSKRTIRTIGSRPIDLYETDKIHLRPLPGFIPEVYRLHHRLVDLEGYVHVHRNRYSVPVDLIGRRVQVRETKQRILVFDGPRRVAEHERQVEGANARITQPEHCPPGRRRPRSRRNQPPSPEERTLRGAGVEFGRLLDAQVKKHGRSIRRVRQLYRMYLDYPTEPLRQSIAEALTYGLLDLARIERMTLRQIAGDYFNLSAQSSNCEEDKEST